MRIRKPSFWAVIGLSLFMLSAAFAQNESSSAAQQPAHWPNGQRLKIGVALEGGGALGLAHIGVLESLEAQHIPIDYIAGTSMGGLVGGMYALGKTPKQMEELIQNQDWDFIIAGQTNFGDLSFRRKEDERAYPNLFEFGLKKGMSLPSGLNSGLGVSMLIDQQTLAYAHSGSFDDFPIPFRCVATNLVTAQPHVFDHGSVAVALRATMSIPGVFAPVREGNNLYVDGGLLGNLPTDVVRSMGADVVIAVHLEITPVDPEEIRSLFSVLGASLTAVIHANELRGMADADLIINVELKDFTALDYKKAQAIITRGKGAADAKSRVLSPYALNDADWNAYLAQRNSREKTAVPAPQFVQVRGASGESTTELQRMLQPLVGKPIDSAVMEPILNRLTGTGKYDSADYWLADDNGRTGLIVTMHEKINEPPTLRLGFEVNGAEPNFVTFTQSGRLTFMDIAGYRSEWRTNFSFGNTYGISSELYRPFEPLGKWFFAPHVDAFNAGVWIFQKSKALAFYRVAQADLGIDAGYDFSRFTEFRAGYNGGYANDNLNLGTPNFASISGRLGDTHLSLVSDHTNDPVVPTAGYSYAGAFHWYDARPGAINTLPALDLEMQGFKPLSAKGTVYATAEGGSAFGFQNTGTPLYFLGAPNRLSAYGTNELYGDQYYLFKAGYLRDLFSLPPFVGRKVYAIGIYEFGKMYGFAGPESGFPNDVAAGVIAETAFGPLFFGGAVGDTGHYKWFFQLGRAF